MGTDITVRFVLLMVLLLISSCLMMLDVTAGLYGLGDGGCTLVLSADPSRGIELFTDFHATTQSSAYEACIHRYETSPTWWVTVAWLALLIAATVVLFWGIPAWRVRRSRVVPLTAVDLRSEISPELMELARSAGLTRMPRIVIDPAASSSGAEIFGRNRQPTICLHGGLIVSRNTDPSRFRAVILRQFAHIRNGDVSVAYASTAAWRVFLAAMFLPYVAWAIADFTVAPGTEFAWPAGALGLARALLLAVFMIALVYLARSDVLRGQKIRACLAAVSWGADPSSWSNTTSGRAGSALGRGLASFTELWRAHPRQDLRRAFLVGPAEVLGVRALPMFLTGAAAALIGSLVGSYLRLYGLDRAPAQQAAVLTAAVLAAGVAGIALWRTVVHAVRAGRHVRSGIWVGLWLGVGIAAANLVTSSVTVFPWLPAWAEGIALVVLASAVFAWLITQCAQLWVRVSWPRARTIRPAFPLTIYLSDEAAHRDVQAAVERLLRTEGFKVIDRDDPISGSWFRRMLFRMDKGAHSPLAGEIARTAAHALDSKVVQAQDAANTATILQALAPVLASLQSTREAVIRVGALLIVQIEGSVVVHQLTATQQLRLDHDPDLLRSPRDILSSLHLTDTPFLQPASPSAQTIALEPAADTHRAHEPNESDDHRE